MSEKTDIDELLNCYVDGEVSERQATEVKRMMLHDRSVAARVKELQRQRQLLASLPAEPAPSALAQSVRGILERRMLLVAASSPERRLLGSLDLWWRKLAAAAAMLALVAGLVVLVIIVLGPPGGPERNIAVVAPAHTEDSRTGGAPVRPEESLVTMELVLKTAGPGALNSVIAKAIDTRGLWNCAAVDRQISRTAYTLSCDRESIRDILGELQGIWSNVTYKSLSVAGAGEEAVVVESVTPEQLAAVVSAPDLPSCVASARQFAEANMHRGDSVAETGTDGDSASQERIPKPFLTSPDFDKAAPAPVKAHAESIRLRVIVAAIP
jgi:hypothetical protein